MKYSLLIVLSCLCLLPVVASGQENGAEGSCFEKWNSALGINASVLAGHGGGGLQFMTGVGPLSVAITAGGTYSPEVLDDNSSGDLLDYSVWAELQYRVFGADFSRVVSGQLYMWLLGGTIGHMDAERYNAGDIDGDSSDEYKTRAGDLVSDGLAGMGIGMELVLFRHISIPVEFGYIGEFPTDAGLHFSCSGGLRYRY